LTNWFADFLNPAPVRWIESSLKYAKPGRQADAEHLLRPEMTLRDVEYAG
jgi:hypothetical protein